MFTLLHDKKVINIAISSAETPCENLQLARGLIESRMSSVDTNLPSSHNTIPSTGYMDEIQPTPTPLPSQIMPPEVNIIPQPQPSSEQTRRTISFDMPLHENHMNLGITIPPFQPNHASLRLQAKKIPATSARRKGVYVPRGKSGSSSSQPTFGSVSRTLGRTYQNENMEVDGDDVDSEDDEYEMSESSTEDQDEEDDLVDEDNLLPCVEDGYDPDRSNEWKEDKDAYFDRLYANGEVYVDKQFESIVLRQWMIFFDKEHVSRVLRDYSIQEGFSFISQKSDPKRLTAICASESCNWRIRASRLSDGYTRAIKSLSGPRTCTMLSLHSPMVSTSWATEKLIDDIKANPEITGKAINALLLKRYDINLKKSSIFETKKLALVTLDGSHDSSYAKLPAYCEVLKITNPGSKAHIAWKVTEYHLEKPIQFKNIFISLRPMIEGFRGCRGLIALDGCHLKGKFGGALMAATVVDANNEIFPLAYGVYENESKDA